MVKIVPSLESKCQFTIVWNLSPNLIHESRKKKMLRTSITDSSSSRSLMTGSAPLTYLIVRPLYLRKKSINHEGIFFIYIMWSKSGYIYYLLGRSLLIKACTWGYAPEIRYLLILRNWPKAHIWFKLPISLSHKSLWKIRQINLWLNRNMFGNVILVQNLYFWRKRILKLLHLLFFRKKKYHFVSVLIVKLDL